MSWKTVELEAVLTLKRGYDLPQNRREDGMVPIFSSSGNSGSHSTAKVEGPGVITGRYGTIGEVFYSPVDFWPLNTTLYVSDFKGLDKRFAYYLLKTVPWQAYQTASAVPGINRNHVSHCPVRIPDEQTQHRIVAVLEAFDAQIDNLVTTNDYLAA